MHLLHVPKQTTKLIARCASGGVLFTCFTYNNSDGNPSSFSRNSKVVNLCKEYTNFNRSSFNRYTKEGFPSIYCQALLPIEVEAGRFKSRTARIRKGATVHHVRESIEKLETQANGNILSIWTELPEDHDESGPIAALLRAKGYKFHHYLKGSFFYYTWLGDPKHDLVPPYMTASQGVGVCVISPDKKHILLQWEHGHWKMVTGTVERGDSSLNTVHKETLEEMGVELEDSVEFVGGWHSHRGLSEDKDGPTNILLAFVAVAKSLDFQVDEVEISQARWVPLSAIPSVNAVDGHRFFSSMEVDLGLPGQDKLQFETALYISVYREKGALKAERWTNERASLQRDVFF